MPQDDCSAGGHVLLRELRIWRLFAALGPPPADRLLIIDEQRLRRVLAEYLCHDNTTRPHRSLRQRRPCMSCCYLVPAG